MLRSIGRVLFGKLLPRYPYPVLRGPLRGSKFILGTLGGSGGGGTVYFNLLEPGQTASFVKILKPGNTLFDVGANVGYYTVLGSRIVGDHGRVISFEPVAKNISFLYRHMVLNNLRNVDIVSAACSDSNSLAVFSAGPTSSMGHIVSDRNYLLENEQKMLVPVVTLDAVSQKLDILPNVLKIDVEGAEVEVLRGAANILSKNKPKIFLSVHSTDLRDECLALLLQYNYKSTPLDGDEGHAREFFCYSSEE